MANGYSMGMTGGTMPVALNSFGSTPVLGIRSSNVIVVDENTPNLEEIQSFPVVRREGTIHFHQDPINGQLYQMTDEFHSRIPQIISGNSSISTNGVNTSVDSVVFQTEITPIPEVIDRFTITPSQQVFSDLLSRSGNLNQLSTTTNSNRINRRSSTFNTSQVINSSVINSQANTLSSQNEFNQTEFFLNSMENNSMTQRSPVLVITNGALRYTYPTARSVQVSTTNIIVRGVNRHSYPRV